MSKFECGHLSFFPAVLGSCFLQSRYKKLFNIKLQIDVLIRALKQPINFVSLAWEAVEASKADYLTRYSFRQPWEFL